jgi:hypothetical protein
MGIRQFEAAMLKEARIVTGNRQLRQKDIVEWTTGECKIVEGETIYFLPELKISIAVKVQPKAQK